MVCNDEEPMRIISIAHHNVKHVQKFTTHTTYLIAHTVWGVYDCKINLTASLTSNMKKKNDTSR